MNAHPPLFPRGTGDLSEHQSLGTAQWVEPHKVVKALGVRSGTSPVLLGWLPNEQGEVEYISHDDDSHMITVAGSRAGKGVSLIIPNLLSYKGSIVCVDLKGENCAVTSHYREEELGQKVVRLDPFKIITDTPDRFNPLEMLDPESEELIDDVTDLAEALIVRGGSKDAHWDDSARAVIKGVILFIIKTKPSGERRLSLLREYILQGIDLDDGDGQDFENLLFAMTQLHDDFLSGIANRIIGMGDNERGSVLSTVQRNTEFLDSIPVGRSVEGSSFDLTEIRDGMTIYLVLPEWRLASHSRWLRLMLTTILQTLQQNPKRSQTVPAVLFVLDEFAALGHMQIIERAAGYIAGFGVKLWSVLQDLSQLKDIYDKRWETFLGNSGILTAFGNIDMTTLDYLSKRLSKAEVMRLETSINEGTSYQSGMKGGGGGSDGRTINPKTILSPLLQPDEFSQLFSRGSGNLYIGLAGEQPVWAHRIRYFEQEPFKTRANPSPYHLKHQN